jgi:hypothetical protein
MAIVKLDIKYLNEFRNDDYLLGDFKLSERSLEKLANVLGMKDIEEAEQWFLDNYEEQNRKVECREFYNQTISRKDIHVDYESELVAYYKGTTFVAPVFFMSDENYKNVEAKQYLNGENYD